MQIAQLTRWFTFNGVNLADLGPAHTPEDVKTFYAGVYPDLLNAEIAGPAIKDDVATYTFKRAVGTKGAGFATLPVREYVIGDDDENIHQADNPQDFDSAVVLLEELRGSDPGTIFTLYAEIDA